MDELIFIGIAHASFIAVFLLSKEHKSLSDKLLVGWIIMLAMPLMTKALSPSMLNVPVPIFDTNIIYSLVFGPFLWLYLKSLTGQLTFIGWQEAYHFLPFLCLSFLQIGFDYTVHFPVAEFSTYTNFHALIIALINLLSLFCYSCAALWRLHQHSKEVVNHFSTLSGKITLKWLNYITIAFVVSYTLPVIGPLTGLSTLLYSHAMSFTLYIFVLSFYGLKQTAIFADGEPLIAEPSTEERSVKEKLPAELHLTSSSLTSVASNSKGMEKVTENPNKYERSGLDEERSRRYLKRLQTYMQEERPYLDASLTIEKLAKQIAIPRHYITQITSEQLGQNFYLFVNQYRIEMVKQTMQQAENDQKKVLDIAYECGFNAKSTFNTAFKNITGMTPSQYKKSLVRK